MERDRRGDQEHREGLLDAGDRRQVDGRDRAARTWVCWRIVETLAPGAAAATRLPTPAGSAFVFANTTFGPLPCVTRSTYARFATMNESFGADGNSCTTPATWNGARTNFPERRSSTRSRTRSPRFSE